MLRQLIGPLGFLVIFFLSLAAIAGSDDGARTTTTFHVEGMT